MTTSGIAVNAKYARIAVNYLSVDAAAPVAGGEAAGDDGGGGVAEADEQLGDVVDELLAGHLDAAVEPGDQHLAEAADQHGRAQAGCGDVGGEGAVALGGVALDGVDQ